MNEIKKRSAENRRRRIAGSNSSDKFYEAVENTPGAGAKILKIQEEELFGQKEPGKEK